jgi:hypothetical protein
MATSQPQRISTTSVDATPSRPRGSVLTEAEEAIVVEFRRRTLLPLDDVLGGPPARGDPDALP